MARGHGGGGHRLHVPGGVEHRDDLDRWAAYLDDLGIGHSHINDVTDPFAYATLTVRDPDCSAGASGRSDGPVSVHRPAAHDWAAGLTLDPDEMVVVETVQATNGPIIVEALRDAGIEAVAVEAFDAVTARHAVQMKVPRRQVREATEVLDRLR